VSANQPTSRGENRKQANGGKFRCVKTHGGLRVSFLRSEAG
jgi:hypothetical protein